MTSESNNEEPKSDVRSTETVSTATMGLSSIFGKVVFCMDKDNRRYVLTEAMNRVFLPKCSSKHFSKLLRLVKAPTCRLSEAEEEKFINCYNLATKKLTSNEIIEINDFTKIYKAILDMWNSSKFALWDAEKKQMLPGPTGQKTVVNRSDLTPVEMVIRNVHNSYPYVKDCTSSDLNNVSSENRVYAKLPFPARDVNELTDDSSMGLSRSGPTFVQLPSSVPHSLDDMDRNPAISGVQTQESTSKNTDVRTFLNTVKTATGNRLTHVGSYQVYTSTGESMLEILSRQILNAYDADNVISASSPYQQSQTPYVSEKCSTEFSAVPHSLHGHANSGLETVQVPLQRSFAVPIADARSIPGSNRINTPVSNSSGELSRHRQNILPLSNSYVSQKCYRIPTSEYHANSNVPTASSTSYVKSMSGINRQQFNTSNVSAIAQFSSSGSTAMPSSTINHFPTNVAISMHDGYSSGNFEYNHLSTVNMIRPDMYESTSHDQTFSTWLPHSVATESIYSLDSLIAIQNSQAVTANEMRKRPATVRDFLNSRSNFDPQNLHAASNTENNFEPFGTGVIGSAPVVQERPSPSLVQNLKTETQKRKRPKFDTDVICID